MMFPKKGLVKKASHRGNVRTALKYWRDVVLQSTGGACALCGGRDRVEPHHIVPRGRYVHNGWFDVDNGIPLCWNHHYNGVHSANNQNRRSTIDQIEKYLSRKDLTIDELKSMRQPLDYSMLPTIIIGLKPYHIQ